MPSLGELIERWESLRAEEQAIREEPSRHDDDKDYRLARLARRRAPVSATIERILGSSGSFDAVSHKGKLYYADAEMGIVVVVDEKRVAEAEYIDAEEPECL